MKKIIYHGSKDIIQQPVYGYGKTYNDYGLGFYCTESPELAKEWSVSLDRDGYSNRYEIDCDGLSVIHLGSEEYCMMHWLSVLLENREFDMPSSLAAEAKKYITRNFHVEYNACDIVIGYRADDSYFSFAQDFLNGTISYSQLSEAMKLGKLGEQFVLKSRMAFERIRFLDYECTQAQEWYAKKMLRDRTARREYFSSEKMSWRKGELYIVQILDEEIKPDDPRLR